MTLRGTFVVVLLVAGLGVFVSTPAAAHSQFVPIRETQIGSVSALPGSLTSIGANRLSADISSLVSHSTLGLSASVDQIVSPSGGSVGVTLLELGGATPISWSSNGSGVFVAASTYKLAALMMEAQNIAAGTTDPDGLVCYQDSDYEDGWFDDYTDGACFTRNELAQRAGVYSDNTAGHMLVRDVGGPDVLNAWAASLGAKSSVFFTDNTTTSNDLAALWDAEATGKLGGAAAQAWLYPLLTNTRTEAGIPAGVGPRSTVVHKTGTLDDVENDAALIPNGPNGPYVLVVLTSGVGGDQGWQVISSVSSAVWDFEASRAQ